MEIMLQMTVLQVEIPSFSFIKQCVFVKVPEVFGSLCSIVVAQYE